MTSAQQLFNGAVSALNGRNLPEAERLFKKLLRIDEKHVPALNLLTVVLMSMDRFSDAEKFIARAVKLNQSSDVSFYNYGLISKKLNKPQQALEQFSRALALNRNVPESWNNRGTIFNDLRNFEAALSDFEYATRLNVNYAEAHANKGNSLYELRRYDEALAAYDRALSLRPELVEAWVGRGNVLNRLKRHDDATLAYARVQALKPDFDFIKGLVVHQKMLCCDWSDLARLVDEITADLLAGRKSAEPFGLLAVARSEESMQRCAQLWNRSKYPGTASALSRRKAGADDRIRVGYLSSDLRDQATSHLIVGMLEAHDKSRFEIVAIDNGWDDNSPVRVRINSAVSKVVDISRLSDIAAAERIREEQIDILVNLNGYFGDERTGVFANRPSPIQVNYLGFPGTLGADYMDYIVADKWVLPPDNMRYYNEKVVYLPDSYQANDRNRAIGIAPSSREECGLPAEGVVFCCFNNNYKITPWVFDSWARILNRVNGSVLWLIEDNPAAADNLRKEAGRRGLDSSRLVFAGRLPLADHLARHALADLFLDTAPCNAHTTASDALWAGLPVLTRIGETFAGRVAASLLNAAGLPELITQSSEAYEALAIELTQDRERLASFKERLQRNRLTMPLFDTRRYTDHIETGYREMYRRHQAGLPPDHIEVH
jgi:predicted O-linked N-acetylglucosamine transferase (SPINDLY family)